MDKRSVFADEWRRSLRAQYQHVAQTGDMVTLPSLTDVMLQVGFGEDELSQLKLQATMHVDDVADGFAPDLNILETAPATIAHPAECQCPQCVPIDESKFDADGQPVTPDPEQEAHEAGHVFPVAEIETEDAEPETYADSLESELPEDDEPLDEGDDMPLEDEEDPDSPQQTSLF